MTTPDDPRREERTEAVDGLVRSVLWRLRARLVTPPNAERAQHDLDQILAAARHHAHEPPGGELAEFRDRITPVAAPIDDADADAAQDGDAAECDAPTPIRPLKLAPTAAAHEGNRGVRISQQVSRVAAVVVLVVGVGGGLAAAVDREGTFIALFASGAANSDAPADDSIAATPSESLELDGGARDVQADDATGAPEPDDGVEVDTSPPADDGDGNGAEVADDTDSDATDTSDGSTGSDGGAAESRDGSSSNGGNGNGSGSSTDPAPTPPADESDDEPTDDGRDDAPSDGDDTVIALPEEPVDPGDLDGFGGSRDCPEGDLRACLPDDGSDDAVAEAEEPTDGESVDEPESDGDDGSEERKKKDPLEELAERRFGG